MAEDQSHKAADPLKPVAAAEFIRKLWSTESLPELSPEAQENRNRAATEIALIFELKDNRSFQWFVREFIDAPYEAVFAKLRDPRLRQPEESLELIQAQYVALKSVKAGVIEREIAHREQIDPHDEEIQVLRTRLARL